MSNAIVEYVEHYQDILAEYLPKGTDSEGWIRSLYLLFSERPELQRAIQTQKGAISLYNGLKVAASSGLSLNPKLGELSVIAYGDKIEILTSKNGWIKLALRSGNVEYLDADIVRENDTFSISKTMDGDRFDHQIETKERGAFIGAYAALKDKRGLGHVCYMTRGEIEAHRDTYSKNTGPGSAWDHSPLGMSVKTVLIKLCRTVHISDDVTATVRQEDTNECNTQLTNKGTGAAGLGAILATTEVINDDNDKDQKEEQGTTDTELLHRQDVQGEVDSTGEGQGAIPFKSNEGDY